MEGTFTNNLKEGLCIMTDEFGDSQVQHFNHDKPTSKETSNSRQFKVPDPAKPIIHNNEPTENTYVKMVDIKSPFIDQTIYNLLLR